MDGGYTGFASRRGLAGTVDKMALVESMGYQWGRNRKLQELVLRRLRGVGSAADAQVLALEQWLCSLPYRREPEEVLRSPLRTLSGDGGDCDDMVVATIAAATALALPAKAEVIADDRGNGFHIRALVGLPPLNPSYWVIIDPVYRSEPQWAMANRNILASQDQFVQTKPVSGLQDTFSGVMQSISTHRHVLLGATALAAAWMLSKKPK